MTKIKCVIVDDEPGAVTLLEILIGLIPSWQLIQKFHSSTEALAFLSEADIDLIFLDINMPKINGIEVARQLPPETHIVFTTAHAEHALESYNVNTIDYLLKPITESRFLLAAKKINEYFRDNHGEEKKEEFLFVKSGKTFRKILRKDILYFEGEKEYARLVTVSEQILVYKRRKELEDELAPGFQRIHQSYIVNLAQVDAIEDNHVKIRQKRMPISNKFRNAFMAMVHNKAL
jgi:two-component system LytT family response regulator